MPEDVPPEQHSGRDDRQGTGEDWDDEKAPTRPRQDHDDRIGTGRGMDRLRKKHGDDGEADAETEGQGRRAEEGEDQQAHHRRNDVAADHAARLREGALR